MCIEIYVDGSCNTSVGIGSWAAFICIDCKQIQLIYHYSDIYQITFVKVKAHQKKGQNLESDRLRRVDKKAQSIVRQTVFQHKT